MAATREEVEQLLQNLFKGGAVERVPRSRKQAEIFLALAAAQVDSKAVLSEAEINEQLAAWLSVVANQNALDHVTLRRYLVDYAFLVRDPNGYHYQTNQAVINRYIEVDARSIHPGEMLAEVAADRARRRQEHTL